MAATIMVTIGKVVVTIETTKSDETESIEEQQNTEIVQSKSENIEIETEISNLQELMNEGNQQ